MGLTSYMTKDDMVYQIIKDDNKYKLLCTTFDGMTVAEYYTLYATELLAQRQLNFMYTANTLGGDGWYHYPQSQV